MYCALYQSCDSHKHIKLERLRSAIKRHSVAVGVPRWVKMSYRSRTRRQCSRCSVFLELRPKVTESWPAWESTAPLTLNSLTSSHKVARSSTGEKLLVCSPPGSAVHNSTTTTENAQKKTLNISNKWNILSKGEKKESRVSQSCC